MSIASVGGKEPGACVNTAVSVVAWGIRCGVTGAPGSRKADHMNSKTVGSTS